MQLQPRPGANADEVNAWWKSLTGGQRDQLIAEHPPELGNLNGIPAEVESLHTDELPVNVGGLGEVRVRVPRERLEEALRVLDAQERERR